jgi:hypothetical protein
MLGSEPLDIPDLAEAQMEAVRVADEHSDENVTASLDLVIFEDHTYIGPDQQKMLPDIARFRRVDLALATQVKAVAPKDRKVFLDAVENEKFIGPGANSKNIDIQVRKNEARWFALFMRTMCRVQPTTHEVECHPTTEEEFQAKLDELIRDSQPPPHPRKP